MIDCNLKPLPGPDSEFRYDDAIKKMDNQPFGM